MIASDLTEVTCPITGACFSVVRSESFVNIARFVEWANDIETRGNAGKSINIAIDCEGYNLGVHPNSLGMVQIGEIFNDSFDVFSARNTQVPQIGQKGGFLLLTPFSQKVKESLNKILTHPKVTIFTFDFTGDFAAILEQGVRINFDRVFDSQVFNTSPSIQNTKIRGLRWFVNQASMMDPLANRAQQFIDQTKPLFFNLQTFFLKDSPHPAQDSVTENTIKIGVTDVYFTGLAAIFCIRRNGANSVIQQTKQKVREFNQIVAGNKNNVLAPSCVRQLAFFHAYKSRNYYSTPQLYARSENDLANLLDIYRDTETIRETSQVLGQSYDGSMSLTEANKLYDTVVPMLNSNLPRLHQMMDKLDSAGSF